MKRTELVFITSPVKAHLPAAVEISRMLTQRDPRISVTFLIYNSGPFWGGSGVTSDSDSIRFIKLPSVELSQKGTILPPIFYTELLKAQVPHVRDAVRELVARSNSSRLGGFVIDLFCTAMIDVADEFGVPSYLFYTSNASVLGFKLHLQFLQDYEGLDLREFKDSDAAIEVPTFVNPVPGKVFLSVMFDKEGGGAEMLLYHIRRFRRAKGIIVNTFVELETHAVQSFSGSTIPPVYSVGPIVSMQGGHAGGQKNGCPIMSWLDDQPPSSVVFLCFGSMGSFSGEQIKEIAGGLERSGHRFLWSLRQSSPPGKMGPPTDYANPEEVLPEGFLGRTASVGKVIGWAPQTDILAHPAVGGFVSHCGWNSLLESIWNGVPVAAWPLYAEQQLNAFQMVKELGLAVEIKLDYRREGNYIVRADEIKVALNNLMDPDSELRKKSKELKETSRKVMAEGGSSHFSFGQFIEDMMANLGPDC